MRDKLIEIIETAKDEYIKGIGKPRKFLTEYIADHLLAAGCILPPCKVGDAVYAIVTTKNGRGIMQGRVEQSAFNKDNKLCIDIVLECGIVFQYFPEYFGEDVFLTREEAEKALAERREG